MNIIEEINKYVDISQKVFKAKKILETLTINWASDPEAMPFEKLRSSSMFSDSWKFLRMDKMKRDALPQFGGADLFQGAQESLIFIELIELMASGEKIIPPIYVIDVVYIDGVRTEKSMDFMDGSHRIRIAEFLQLPEIPIAVFERVSSYVFPVNKWIFKEKEIVEQHSNGNRASRNGIEATSIDGRSIVLNMGKYKPSIKDGSENGIFPEYLQINIGL